MNSTKFLFVFFVIVFLLDMNLSAQSAIVRIMQVSGNIQIGSMEHWAQASVSQKLKNSDYVKVGENSCLVMVDEKLNKVKVLDNEGTYKVSEQWSKVPSSSPGLFKRFLKLLEDQLFNKGNKEVLSAAAVKRSTNAIRIASPESSKVIDKGIPLKWYKVDNGFNYCLTISNRWGEKIFTKSLFDTSFVVNYHDLNLKDSEYYFWKISSCKDPNVVSNEGSFYIDNQELKNKLADSIAAINKMFPEDEFSPVKEFTIASFLMENELNFDALAHFEKLETSPFFFEEYRNCFINFLLNVSMIDKANTFIKNN